MNLEMVIVAPPHLHLLLLVRATTMVVVPEGVLRLMVVAS